MGVANGHRLSEQLSLEGETSSLSLWIWPGLETCSAYQDVAEEIPQDSELTLNRLAVLSWKRTKNTWANGLSTTKDISEAAGPPSPAGLQLAAAS